MELNIPLLAGPAVVEYCNSTMHYNGRKDKIPLLFVFIECRRVFLGVQDNSDYVAYLYVCESRTSVCICMSVCVCAELDSEFMLDVCVCIHICMFNPLLSGQLKSDLVKEVAYTRRKQHQASLQYYCALNALQYRKRVAMLEPMLGYTQAQVLSRCFAYKLGQTSYQY